MRTRINKILTAIIGLLAANFILSIITELERDKKLKQKEDGTDTSKK